MSTSHCSQSWYFTFTVQVIPLVLNYLPFFSICWSRNSNSDLRFSSNPLSFISQQESLRLLQTPLFPPLYRFYATSFILTSCLYIPSSPDSKFAYMAYFFFMPMMSKTGFCICLISAFEWIEKWIKSCKYIIIFFFFALRSFFCK